MRITTAVIVALPILTCISAGCRNQPLTGPGDLRGPGEIPALVLADVLPNRGLAGDLLTIRGTGFSSFTGLTIGGVASTVLGRTSTTLMTLAPSLPPGSVDITVANPNGERKTLAEGFTVDTVAISASPSAVTVGGPLSVTFGAPIGRPVADWIGLFRLGDPNDNYIWYEYTNGSTQGTITIPAPDPPGDYQFRYLADDGYVDAARSGVVTVTAAGGNVLAPASARAMPTPMVPLMRPGRGRGR